MCIKHEVFITFYFSINLIMEKPNLKSAVGKEKLVLVLLTRACYSFDCSVLIVINFSTLATVAFFDNVVALHSYIMTRKPTRFNAVNDLIVAQGV